MILFLILQDNNAMMDTINKNTGVSYRVHAFYYSWYASDKVNGKWSHWNHETIPHWTASTNMRYPRRQHHPPEDIAAKFYPQLGPYSSTDPEVIRDHMKQLIRGGIGVLALSWYPPSMRDDNAIVFVNDFVPLILDIADEFQEKVCFHIEPYTNRTAKSVRHDIAYLIDHYGGHPAFYRYKNKPLIYIYDSYTVPSEDWKELLTSSGSYTVCIILLIYP